MSMIKKIVVVFGSILAVVFLATAAHAADLSQENIEAQPKIRVGVYKTNDAVKYTSRGDVVVYAGDEEMGVLPSGEVAVLGYDNKQYSFYSDALQFVSDNFIRIVPAEVSEIFTLPSVVRTLSGHKGRNYNQYRGIFEYRYSPKSKMPYIINELLLEDYVAGVAETGDGTPYEYIKALQTAARTYAYVNIDPRPATEKHLFDVYASTVDQLYLGYVAERVNSQVVAATRETAGELVTFQGKPVITFYFGHSDGKTRGWQKLGKTPRPWLQSVVAVYDKGLKLWGHGVGMSTRDALMRAKKDGWTYDQILSYYYTGTKLEKVYE